MVLYAVTNCITGAAATAADDHRSVAHEQLVRRDFHESVLADRWVHLPAADVALVHRRAALVWWAVGYHSDCRTDHRIDHRHFAHDSLSAPTRGGHRGIGNRGLESRLQPVALDKLRRRSD